MNFTEMVLDPIRTYLDNRRLTVPGGVEGEHGVSWTAEDENALTIVARVPVSYLAANLQENQASVPSFLVCLAYWLEKIRSEPVHCRIVLIGDICSSAGVHVRRSMLLILVFEAGIHGRFQCVP